MPLAREAFFFDCASSELRWVHYYTYHRYYVYMYRATTERGGVLSEASMLNYGYLRRRERPIAAVDFQWDRVSKSPMLKHPAFAISFAASSETSPSWNQTSDIPEPRVSHGSQ